MVLCRLDKMCFFLKSGNCSTENVDFQTGNCTRNSCCVAVGVNCTGR